jgi:outer membrane biosynthesis protein TonB
MEYIKGVVTKKNTHMKYLPWGLSALLFIALIGVIASDPEVPEPESANISETIEEIQEASAIEAELDISPEEPIQEEALPVSEPPVQQESQDETIIQTSQSLTNTQQTSPSSQPEPQQESQPTPTPTPQQDPEPQSSTPSTSVGYTCSCSKTCPQMASCEEAYFQLNQCGCGARDGDNDGIPCESICR